LTAETKYGETVTNVKRKRIPGGGSSYSKTTRTKTWRILMTIVSYAHGVFAGPKIITKYIYTWHQKQSHQEDN